MTSPNGRLQHPAQDPLVGVEQVRKPSATSGTTATTKQGFDLQYHKSVLDNYRKSQYFVHDTAIAQSLQACIDKIQAMESSAPRG